MATKYTYRGKEYTYEEFMEGPGGKLTTDAAYAALDKASGATKSRRALQMAMAKSGAKLVSADAAGVKFKTASGDLSFNTFGEVEKYLLDKGLIRDEKAEAAKKAAEKKEKDKAKAAAKKEADKKKAAEKKAADKAKAKAKAVAKKEADKKKAAAKKAADKAKAAKKPAVKKTATKPAAKKATAVKKTTKTVAKKFTAVKKAVAKTAAAKKTAAKKPVAKKSAAKAAAPKKAGRPKKAAATKTAVKTTAKTTRRVSVPVSKNLKDSGLVIKVGRREYTQERLKGLALDSYKYDMGKDPKGAKVELYVQADAKKCLFIVNGKDKGEIDL